MGNARNPGREFSGISITPLLYGHNSLDESLLEDVVGHVLILDDIEYICENTSLVALQKRIESLVVTACICSHQLFVGQLCHFLHVECVLFKIR